MQWILTLEDTAQKLGLKKSGSQWQGPCPCCGGHDRFWIRRGSKQDIVATCRQGCSFGEIAKEMKKLGLMEENYFSFRPRYKEADITHATTMVMLAENMMDNNQTISEDDVLHLSVYIPLVPEDVQQSLRSTITLMKERL